MAKPILLNPARPLLLLSIVFFASCRKPPKAPPVVTTPDYDKGLSFLNRQNDSAYYYFNKVVNSSKDGLQLAMALNNMAICESNAGDYYGSQEDLLTSLRYLHEDSPRHQWCRMADYNELGTDNLNLKNYDAAIRYYDLTARLVEDSGFKAIALNNKALSYEKNGQYVKAIVIYDSITQQSKQNKKQYARVLTNRAMAKWRQDPTFDAAPDLLAALKLRLLEKDAWGLNSSYSHLADFYAGSRPDLALGYAREMYAVASQLGSPDDEVEALRKLILLAPPNEAKGYFAQYQRMQDSLETARNRAKNQLALIRYETEKNRADNARLQQENAVRRVEVAQQQAVIFGVLVVLVLVIWWGIGWYQRRRQQLQRNAEKRIRESELRTSQKVHDVVANGIYGLMSALEHGVPMEKEQVVDRLNGLYRQSREISYDARSAPGERFQAKVSLVLAPYGRADRKVLIIGNEDAVWSGVSAAILADLEAILQELMVNMDKHSYARNVVLRFVRDGKALLIYYTDDGVGLPSEPHVGNGLTSTGNRIAANVGQISFEPNLPTGVKIRIHFPND